MVATRTGTEIAAVRPPPGSELEATTVTATPAAGDRDSAHEADAVPWQLEAKLKRLRGDASRLHQWTLVPKPFVGLMMFCIGFAVISLIALLIMATTVSDTDGSHSSSDDDASYDKESSNVLLGVGVFSSIVGSLQTASGYCAQRLSHQITALIQRRARTKSSEASPKQHPLFFIGLLLLVCGTISAIVNLGILGQSVTAPFAAMTLIFNGCLASTVLHEAVTKYDIVATVLVLLGVGVAMLGVGMAHLEAQAFTLADIETIFSRSAFPALYSVVVLGALACFFVIIKKRRLQTKSAGLCCFSIGAGVLSGFSSLCVKYTVEVLKGVSQHHSRDLSNPVLYVFVVGIPVCVLSQLKLMTLGLEHFGTLKFVPPYHAFIILSNLINGMVYFDEASGYDALSASLFVAGCTVTVCGVFVLLAKVPKDAQVEDETATAASLESAKASRDDDRSTEATSSSDTDPGMTPPAPVVTAIALAAEKGHDNTGGDLNV